MIRPVILSRPENTAVGLGIFGPGGATISLGCGGSPGCDGRRGGAGRAAPPPGPGSGCVCTPGGSRADGGYCWGYCCDGGGPGGSRVSGGYCDGGGPGGRRRPPGTSAGGRNGPKMASNGLNCACAGAAATAPITASKAKTVGRAIGIAGFRGQRSLIFRASPVVDARPVTISRPPMAERLLICRPPRPVVAGGARAAPLRQGRTARPVGRRRAGQIGPVRLLPRVRAVLLGGRRYVDRVMQPAVPARRHARGLGVAVIDHPAPLEAKRLVDLAAARAVVVVAVFVLADEFAIEPRPQLRAERLTVPPGEEAQQQGFHGGSRGRSLRSAASCHLAATVSRSAHWRRLRTPAVLASHRAALAHAPGGAAVHRTGPGPAGRGVPGGTSATARALTFCFRPYGRARCVRQHWNRRPLTTA